MSTIDRFLANIPKMKEGISWWELEDPKVSFRWNQKELLKRCQLLDVRI